MLNRTAALFLNAQSHYRKLC